jgi:N-6 DNA Methylase
MMNCIQSELDLAAVALALIGPDAPLSPAERELGRRVRPSSNQDCLTAIRVAILSGEDPLGDAFSRIRSPGTRRSQGATYTPAPLVKYMLSWAAAEATPRRVIDPGAGSGRFLLAAARRFPRAELVAVELDPLPALILRANVVVRGLADRTALLVGDYRTAALPAIAGTTLFIGNPPYVRHHDIGASWKAWFAEASAGFGIKASKLAGLHIHFFIRTLQLARSGDVGVFITSAEWLDVNYGATLRQLLANGLGGVAIHVLDSKAMPFDDAATTGAIACFRVGRRAKGLLVRSVDSTKNLRRSPGGRLVPWEEVAKSRRWSTLIRPHPKTPEGFIELGELCRVHRGQVTGNNEIWIAGRHVTGLPDAVLEPTVTKAREILEAGVTLDDTSRLRRVVNLPPDLDALDPAVLPAVLRFLNWARQQGAHESYIARHRRAWWSVGLKDPAPIICTYMARRSPAFVRNRCAARHINIAHGLYPRQPLSERTLMALVAWLRGNVSVENGRTYAGGLTKFEPRELERVPIPAPEILTP